MKVAVVIGHSANSPGKFSKIIQISEYFYNEKVSHYLKDVDIYRRPEGGGYKTKMRKLGDQFKPPNYDLIVELHFNAYDDIDNNKGHGVETKSYPGNKNTEIWGKEYCLMISNHYCTFDRGSKKVAKGDRGWWFLYYMPTNAIIVEPFFGDESESLKFISESEYAYVFMQWLESIK